jgi:hypothetical protein
MTEAGQRTKGAGLHIYTGGRVGTASIAASVVVVLPALRLAVLVVPVAHGTDGGEAIAVERDSAEAANVESPARTLGRVRC